MSVVVRTSEADDGVELRARVTVSGFPGGCKSTAEESVPVHREGPPPELDRYKQLSLSEELGRLDFIMRKLRESESERVLYFALGKNPGETDAQREKRMNAIRAYLFEKGVSNSDLVFFNLMHGETVVWAVPVPQPRKEGGDSDPAARQIECPMITVTGPGGIVEPGGVAEFTAAIEGTVPKGIKLKWTVTDGTIIEGEEDYTMRVLTPRNPYRVDATFRVEGLDKRCPYTATEYAEFGGEPEFVLLDEFSASVSEIPRDALKRAVAEHGKFSTNQIFIIEYFPASTSELSINEKIRRMKDYMSRELEFDTSAVTIVIDELDEPLTRIYLVPPGADNPTP